MTESGILDLLARMLSESTGNASAYWYRVLGGVLITERENRQICNWSMAPMGSVLDIKTAELAIKMIQREYPIIQRG